ncbi:MAG: MBL fold metallo-hydrolase [Bacteroidales bacterium]|nr:MBL fold metallo-hydrolase [Bacteroidales bacterium]
MTISILTDNRPGSDLRAEHGLSYLVEHNGAVVLFDTGQSDLFLQNASKMGINLDGVGFVVLSHGHFDHGNGLKHLSGKKLVCHPDSFVKRYRKTDKSYIGLEMTKPELARRFDLVETSAPYKVSEEIIFLGEIPRVTDFESQTTPFIFSNGEPDFVMDDSAIALVLPDGLFVITGCGHSGVVNTLLHAQQVTGINNVCGVMGGFHLKKNDRQTQETIVFLKKHNVKHIYPSHCTDLPALSAFYDAFNIKQIRTGDILRF